MAPNVDGNNQPARSYFYATYDDVHGKDVETSKIDKNDSLVNSVFNSCRSSAATYANTKAYEEDSKKARLLDDNSLLQKARGIYDSLVDKKFTGITYQTDTQENADVADEGFGKALNDINTSANAQIDKAIREALAELKEISVTNELNRNGGINGAATYTKDAEDNITGVNVISNTTGNSFRYKKGDDGKFYEVDSSGNHVKDKAGNEKVYTLNDDGSLVRDNSNAKPAKSSKPAASGNNGSSKPVEVKRWTDESGNTQIKYSNGNIKTIYNDGDETYATRENTFNQDGNCTSAVLKNKQGQVTAKTKFTYNKKDGTYYNDTTYHNGAENNSITRSAHNTNGTITNKEKAVKAAGLRGSKTYTGYYTDGKNFYRWDKENTRFVMVTKTSLRNIFNKWNPKCD